MEDILSLAFSGVYLLLIISLAFNFLLTTRLHSMHGTVTDAEARSFEEARLMEERLRKVKAEILHRRGLI
ncbi:MAG: hypothetical protein V3T58_05155 [Candidatus Hydrothermarchaeales archaeon]